MPPRNLRPIRLSRRIELFDSDQFIFELKVDGFRALAHIDAGRSELISRGGNVFRGFANLAAWIAEHLPWKVPSSMVRLLALKMLVGRGRGVQVEEERRRE